MTEWSRAEMHRALGPSDSSVDRPSISLSVAGTHVGGYKVAEQKTSKTWLSLPLPEQLDKVGHNGKSRKYPNTPLAITCYEGEGGLESFLLVGLLHSPTLLKVIQPKQHEPDRGGRFNTL